jgi:hypothetical protein
MQPPSQGWKTFLRNHADAIASMDMFVVPTVSFRLLYGLLILRHARRELLWLNVSPHPNAEWTIHVYDTATGAPVVEILRPGKTPSGVEVQSPDRAHPPALARHPHHHPRRRSLRPRRGDDVVRKQRQRLHDGKIGATTRSNG